jgi:hypothetical protein
VPTPDCAPPIEFGPFSAEPVSDAFADDAGPGMLDAAAYPEDKPANEVPAFGCAPRVAVFPTSPDDAAGGWPEFADRDPPEAEVGVGVACDPVGGAGFGDMAAGTPTAGAAGAAVDGEAFALVDAAFTKGVVLLLV